MERYFKTTADLLTHILREETMIHALQEATDVVLDCYRANGKLLIAGNGGSAADAQHWAAELMGKFMKVRRPLPAIALTVDTSMLTAWANDVSFETVFARQIEGLGKPDDVFVAISTSGNSANLINALATAKGLGLRTVGLLGRGGGRMKELCDVAVIVPSDSTPLIQTVHEIAFHAICEEVERTIT